MSSLIPDSSLIFSPQLAATIGLEEAILLQVLHDVAMLQSNQPFTLTVAGLAKKLPFWSVIDLQRVTKSLGDKGVIHVYSPPLTQTEVLQFDFDVVSAHVGASVNPVTPPAAASNITAISPAQKGANRISATWQPDATALGQLKQLHGIPDAFSREQVPGFVLYWRERNEIAHSWGAKFLEHVLHRWQRQRADLTFLHPTSEASNMGAQWQPNPDAISILQSNGISLAFIEDAIPEFVLYWRERGEATTTWNSKFIQHVKKQWARFTSTLKYDTEPRRIPANWQPEPEVFEILKMANINAAFAQSVLPEFVLYWKESNKLQSSWNTKFLQHVKYCWANQNLLRLNHEGQQNTAGDNTPAISSFVAKHTDRSWREGV